MFRGLIFSTVALALTTGLTACSTVSQNIPTVKIERKPKRVKTVQANYTAPKVTPAEAAMVCENEDMRIRAADKNKKNDMARVLILQEGRRSSNIIADREVNCRDYFKNASYAQEQTNQKPADYTQTTPVISPAPVPRIQPEAKIVKSSAPIEAADGYYYSIKKGDTLYRIARENCSSVKDVSNLNGISDPTQIEIHQIIRLPAQKCNARK